jgi:hypothetical protein
MRPFFYVLIQLLFASTTLEKCRLVWFRFAWDWNKIFSEEHDSGPFKAQIPRPKSRRPAIAGIRLTIAFEVDFINMEKLFINDQRGLVRGRKRAT